MAEFNSRSKPQRRLSYSVLFKGKTLVRDATATMTVDKAVLGQDPKVTGSHRRTVDQQLVPPVAQKFARIHEHFNELRLDMEGDYTLVFRAYNEGVAYRFETSLPRSEVKVYAEEVNLNFAADYSVYYPQEESFFSHNEREFGYVSLKSITPQTLASVPAVVDAGDGIKIFVADSDVEDYPGLWFRGNSGSSLSGVFPPVSSKGTVKQGQRPAGNSGCRLHCGYPWKTNVSLATPGTCREGWRPVDESTGLPAGQTFSG